MAIPGPAIISTGSSPLAARGSEPLTCHGLNILPRSTNATPLPHQLR